MADVWDDVAPEFSPSEFNAPDKMEPYFLRRLHRSRLRAGVPFRFVSDHRAPGIGVKNSAHTEDPCSAVDLRAENTYERWQIVESLIKEGFTRIGIYPPNDHQKTTYGKGSGSIHVDASTSRPSPRIWTGF